MVKIVVNTSMRLDAEPLILRYLWTHEHTSSLWYWHLNAPWYTVNLSGSCSYLPALCRTYGVAYAVWYVARDCPCVACCISLPYGQIRRYNQSQLWACLSDWQIVKERIECGANEKAVWRLFINCPFVCINFDFFWLNKARQLYMDF